MTAAERSAAMAHIKALAADLAAAVDEYAAAVAELGEAVPPSEGAENSGVHVTGRAPEFTPVHARAREEVSR
jgi:hypothetical protein